jgi:endoglycosylceramidase
VFDQTVLGPFMHKVITAIHSVNPQVVTYYEPNVLFDFGAVTSIGKLGANSGMSFHDYCPAGNLGLPQGGSGAAGCEAAEQRVFQNANAQSQRSGDALLLTEFGATGDSSVIGRLANDADQNMVGWEYWAYCGCSDPTGSPQVEGLVGDPAEPPTGSNVDANKLAVLDRPYPQTVAGTPTRFSYDAGTDVFKLTYTTARASRRGRFPALSETDVYVPALHYPHGYSVTVIGAAPISRRGASILRLLSCPGTRRVTVRVAAGRHSVSDCSIAIPNAKHRRAAARHRRSRHSASFTG